MASFAVSITEATPHFSPLTDIHTRDQSGGTSLHKAAARNRDLAFVAAHVAVGANLNAKDSASNTPLHASRPSFNPEMVLTLLEPGANPAARNNED